MSDVFSRSSREPRRRLVTACIVACLDCEERGATRVDNGQADIGAYEVHQADVAFNTSFEGCLF